MIFVIDGLDFHGDLLNFIESSIIHSFLEGIFPDEFFNVETCFLKIDFEEVNFFPEIKDGIFINITFDS